MSVAEERKPMRESDVVRVLRTKYAGGDWVLIPQVPDGTGGNKSRTADAIAMSLWPSRGLELHGFEVKVSRSDWLKELNGSGAKAHAVAKHCERWWIVATAGIVKIDELPVAWGLMVVNAAGDGMTVKKQAPVQSSEPITRKFLAGLLRAADRHYASIHTPDGHAKELQAKFQSGYEAGLKAADSRTGTNWQERYDELAKQLLAFQQSSGITINQYSDGKKIGELVQKARLLDGRQLRVRAEELRRASRELGSIADQLSAP